MFVEGSSSTKRRVDCYYCDIHAQFIGDNNNARFALQTDDFEETFARAGLGFGLILKNNKSAYLMVDGDFGRDLLQTYYINAGFRWQF